MGSLLNWRSKAPTDVQALLRENDILRREVEGLQARVVELESLAGEDPLVGLANRRCFVASLEAVIGRVARYDVQASLIFIDVDGLKAINDCYGHSSGDAALVQIARLISEVVRPSDHVGRLGGDEFSVILEQADELSGWQIALRIVESVMASELSVSDTSIRLSVAVGVTPINADDDAKAVLHRADEQMYRIKKKSSRRLPG